MCINNKQSININMNMLNKNQYQKKQYNPLNIINCKVISGYTIL